MGFDHGSALRLDARSVSTDAVSGTPAGTRPESVAALLVDAPPFPPDTSCSRVHDAFVANPALHAIPIVDGHAQPVGLVSRQVLLDAFARPFGRDRLARREVAAFMNPRPLVVDLGTSLDDVSRIIVDEGGRYIYDGFIITEGGRYVGMGTGYGLIRALAERRQAQLFHLAHHDALTGLPNRHLFDDRLRQTLASAERSATLVGVMLIDLDRFKRINESLGHEIGDQVLKIIAGRLAGYVRRSDTVARISSDEFGIILPNLTEPEDATVVARKLVDALREPLDLEGHDVRLSCSIGIGLYPHHGTSADAVVRSADAAALHAKGVRNTFQLFSKDMLRPARGRCTYTSLAAALEARELEIHYQPQIDLTAGRVTTVEALVRWHHAELGPIAASEIVSVAEDTGLITALFEWLLREACEQVRRWSIPGDPLRLAVNVSGVQFRQDRLLPAVANILAATGFDPRQLEFEITETVVMRNAPATLAALRHLRGMGVRIAVDDFGIGYSSLSYLRRLPVDVLKIDKLFIHEIGEDEQSAAIVRAIITLAHSLRLRVVAEGVETAEQLALLRAHACDSVQGFYFSEALPPAVMAGWLAERKGVGSHFRNFCEPERK